MARFPQRPSSDARTTAAGWRERLAAVRAVFSHVPATLALVWRTDRRGTAASLMPGLLLAVIPAAIAYVGKVIVDAVVAAGRSGLPGDVRRVLWLVAVEAALMGAQLVAARMLALRRDLLRTQLGNALHERIIEKALALELRDFEDSAVYDKMQNARRDAASRPHSLVLQLFGIAQHAITLAALSGLLWHVSPTGVLVLVAASIPAFLAEARFSGEAFRINTWRAQESRRVSYLEWLLTRDSHVKEVKLFGLGPLLLGRFRALYRKFFVEDAALARRRMRAGILYGGVSLAAFYVMYAFMARRAATGAITLGDLTLYIIVFRQGQGSVQAILASVGALYEDALYMSNLFAFLALPDGREATRAAPARSPARGRPLGLEIEEVSFRYPGRESWALRGVSLALAPGEKLALVGQNGAGKSTLVKLLLGFYEPTEGAIRYGGIDLRDMAPADLRSRVGAVFQDFARYQLSAAENIGLGHPAALEDRARIEAAARRAGADELVASLPQRYDTLLGGWFEHGHELSAGQWQKLAIARAFMRHDAEILIFDEPTAAVDAEGERELFERFRELSADRSTIVISHRFSTVRRSDRIAVLHRGRLEELGTHRQLLEQGGRYAHLFSLQAQGYVD